MALPLHSDSTVILLLHNTVSWPCLRPGECPLSIKMSIVILGVCFYLQLIVNCSFVFDRVQ